MEARQIGIIQAKNPKLFS